MLCNRTGIQMAHQQLTYSPSWIPRWATIVFAIAISIATAYTGGGDFNRLRQQSQQAEVQGDVPQAIRLSLKMLELQPGDLATMVALSGLYGKAEQPQQQLAFTQRILKLQPNHFDALVNQGNALAALGNLKEAKDSFKKASGIESNNPVAPYSLGVLAQSQGKDEEAIGFFQTALKMSPAFEDALFNLAVSYANIGRFRDAIGMLDRLLRKNPDAMDAKQLRATLRLQLR